MRLGAALATTNKMCQEVAVVPFLWVVPLGLYLLSFIICFDSPRWYRRFPFGPRADRPHGSRLLGTLQLVRHFGSGADVYLWRGLFHRVHDLPWGGLSAQARA